MKFHVHYQGCHLATLNDAGSAPYNIQACGASGCIHVQASCMYLSRGIALHCSARQLERHRQVSDKTQHMMHSSDRPCSGTKS